MPAWEDDPRCMSYVLLYIYQLLVERLTSFYSGPKASDML